MTWEVLQTRRFSRVYKKLKKNIQADIDEEVEKIAKDPLLGEQKKGDLAQLRVHKFYSGSQQYLLGYTLEEQPRLIYLEAIGPHENFYRDLKR
jgi:mRNA-degrading endonuclease RelE of RelBE toxin-antitoxin system